MIDFRSKIRCFGEQPFCSTCQKRDLDCHYHPLQQTPPHREVRERKTQHDPDVDDMALNSAQRNLASITMGLLSPAITLGRPDSNTPLPTPQDGGDVTIPDLDMLLNTSPDGQLSFDLCDSGLLWNNVASPDFHSNLGWIFEDAGGNEFLGMPDLNGLVKPSSFLSSGLPPMPATGRQTIQNFSQTSMMGNEEDDETETLTNLPAPRPHEGCNVGDPWPMEWHASPTKRHLVLPMLGIEGQSMVSPTGRFFSVPPISESTRTALKECLQLPFKGSPWQTLNLQNWPSAEKLDTCIDLFFVRVHQVSRILSLKNNN